MQIDPLYGPQFDPTDGTLGRIQLLKRWVLVSGSCIWTPARGAFTYDKAETANRHASLLREIEKAPPDLRAEAYWCWPGTHDPVYRANRVLSMPVLIESDPESL